MPSDTFVRKVFVYCGKNGAGGTTDMQSIFTKKGMTHLYCTFLGNGNYLINLRLT